MKIIGQYKVVNCVFSLIFFQCVKLCLSTPFNKPGRCPDKILSPFDAVCMETCAQDLECLNLKKCCRHNCGSTCQEPEELLSAVGEIL